MEGTTTTWLRLWNSANTQKSQSQREIILLPGEQDFVPSRQEHPISKHAGLPHSHLVECIPTCQAWQARGIIKAGQ